jgi:hypothetical protein
VPLDAFGNDPAHWQIRADLPGGAGQSAGASPLAGALSLCSFAAQRDAQSGGMVLRWTLDAPLPADVTGFALYRSRTLDRAGAVPVPMQPADTGAAAGSNTGVLTGTADLTATLTVSVAAGTPGAPVLVYTVTDAGVEPGAPAYYWLEAERSGAAPLPVAVTSPLQPWRELHLPVVRR